MPALERVKKTSSHFTAKFKEVEKCHFPYTAPFCTCYSATTVLQPRPPEKIDLMVEIILVVDFTNSKLLTNLPTETYFCIQKQ